MANVDVTRIASNIGALNALNSLETINKQLAIHQTRLSTGKRINSASDDPAGLTIATKMFARSEGLKASMGNISDASNMLSVAEGGLSKMTDILTQMRTKAEQAASDTLGASERAAIATQLSAYSQQIQDVVDQTKWNGVKLLDTTTGEKFFQTGVDEGEYTKWSLPGALDPTTMGLSKKVIAATATSGTQATSFGLTNGVAVNTAGTLGNMSELTTGDYNFTILAKALNQNVGLTTLDSGSAFVGGVKSFNAVAENITTRPANTMTSGQYSLKILGTSSDGQNTSYQLTKIGDTSFGTNGVLTVSNANLTASTWGQVAGTATNAATGLPSALGFVNTAATTAIGANAGVGTGQTEFSGGGYKIQVRAIEGVPDTFDYRVLDASDNPQSIWNGTAGGGGKNGVANYTNVATGGWVTGAAIGTPTIDTGRGMSFTLNLAAGAYTAASVENTAITYTSAGTAGDLIDVGGATGQKLGVNIGSSDYSKLAVGATMSFDYIAKDQAKFALLDGSGLAQQIARGVDASGTQLSGTYSYATAGTQYDSGRGVSMTLAALANISTTANNVQNFTFERANNFSVNVSTAAKAGAYMTTTNTAMDKITSALSDLGSLMARLNFKSDQVATDQVNVEGAYSRIMNANMAEEQMNASKYSILQQTAVAMLAQANQAPQSLLSLFK